MSFAAWNQDRSSSTALEATLAQVFPAMRAPRAIEPFLTVAL